jgi:hypothetical protein
MPEYLAPGVYIEEVSFRAKTIEGVSTSTAGFVGPTRYGPTGGEPELLTSFADFERIYGGLDQLDFGGTLRHNYLAHAVRAFFEEGGKRLYVSRVYSDTGGQAETTNSEVVSPPTLTLTARFPGQAGNLRVTFIPRLSDNLLVQDPITGNPQVRRIQENDTVLVSSTGSPPAPRLYDVVREGDILYLQLPDGTRQEISNSGINPTQYRVQLLTVDVSIERPINRPKRPNERYTIPQLLEGFSFHPDHARSLTTYFTENPRSRLLGLTVPFAITPTLTSIDTGVEMAQALLGSNIIDNLLDENATQEEKQRVYRLEGGSDGSAPDAGTYEGESTSTSKSGLAAFESIEDISIVAAPGYSYNYISNTATSDTIQAHLINHCLKMRYRIAVLDSANEHTLAEVREYRGKVDSTHAALYYPWIRILDPITEEEITLPPSGFVAGIYARNDVEHGVHKAPANEVVRLAIGFEFLLNKAQQDVLNPEGINCFRFFEGRGYRLWGARTISSDPEWKYVNLRRYFAFLERSIEKGTQWVVFENNHDPLWANVRRTIEDFLFNEWKSGHLMGEKPQEAFFVRCDRSTMTQNDIDNGRLICLIGVAPVRPAEFVIFRIGQWTADRRS